LFDDPNTVREGNRYWKWIQNYVAEDYTAAVKLGSGECDVEKVSCFFAI
jgi:hypothetical protein